VEVVEPPRGPSLPVLSPPPVEALPAAPSGRCELQASKRAGMASTAENRSVNMKLALIFIFMRAASSAPLAGVIGRKNTPLLRVVDRIGVDEALGIAVDVAADVFVREEIMTPIAQRRSARRYFLG
jgi:hypothetical protein